MRDSIDMIKIDITVINDLRLSAMTFAEYDGYKRCVNEIFKKKLMSLQAEQEGYKRNLQEAEQDNNSIVAEYFAGKLNDITFDISVLNVQYGLVLDMIPKYIFPADYDTKVKNIMQEQDADKIASDIMSTFAVTTKKGAELFYQSLFLGIKGTGTKARAGIKKTKSGIEQSAENVRYVKNYSRKQIEQNITLFICDKIARSNGYLFSYDIYLSMTWEKIVAQIETVYKDASVEGWTGTRDTAEKIVRSMRKAKAQEAQEA